MIKHGHKRRGQRVPEYTAWQGMIQRCEVGRGIYRTVSVCEEWRRSYSAFLSSVGNKPGPDYSLDRIDNTRGYEPGNVRWATRHDQDRNKTNNHRLTVDGVTMCATDWSARTGIPARTIISRIARGFTSAEAVAQRRYQTGPARGTKRRIVDWLARHGDAAGGNKEGT